MTIMIPHIYTQTSHSLNANSKQYSKLTIRRFLIDADDVRFFEVQFVGFTGNKPCDGVDLWEVCKYTQHISSKKEPH